MMCPNLIIDCSQILLCIMQKKHKVKTIAQLAYHTELFMPHLELNTCLACAFFALQLGWISFCAVMISLCVILLLSFGSL